MRRIYQALLGLYPGEHQAQFAAEMLETFDRAAAKCSLRGPLAMSRFALRELAGLLAGLTAEWFAKWTAPRMYIHPGRDPQDVRQKIIRNMEHAIANHDFTRARFYSVALDCLDRRLDEGS